MYFTPEISKHWLYFISEFTPAYMTEQMKEESDSQKRFLSAFCEQLWVFALLR